MAKEKNSISVEDVWELKKRAHEEDHEQLASDELLGWYRKWEHTDIAQAIRNFMVGGRRTRGHAFNKGAILATFVFLQKIGMTEAAAKKEVAKRFNTTLRNVQGYVGQEGGAYRQIIDFMLAKGLAETGPVSLREALIDHKLKLTPEERKKLVEIAREK